MVREFSIESYRFTCRSCEHTWMADYRVSHAFDREGTPWTVHYRDGVPAENPAADVVLCPHCHHATIDPHLIARHDIPAPPTHAPNPHA